MALSVSKPRFIIVAAGVKPGTQMADNGCDITITAAFFLFAENPTTLMLST